MEEIVAVPILTHHCVLFALVLKLKSRLQLVFQKPQLLEEFFKEIILNMIIFLSLNKSLVFS